MFVINIFLAIYISIKIHIADYPEYGGRKRNEEYINSHPDEFGSVSSGEFVIAALCPTLAAIAQFICMFFSIALFRRIYYLPENYEDGKKQNDVVTITNENERKDIQIVGYRRNLKMTKTDDRLYPNKKNLPEDLKYSSERVFEEIKNEVKEEEKNNKENIKLNINKVKIVKRIFKGFLIIYIRNKYLMTYYMLIIYKVKRFL